MKEKATSCLWWWLWIHIIICIIYSRINTFVKNNNNTYWETNNKLAHTYKHIQYKRIHIRLAQHTQLTAAEFARCKHATHTDSIRAEMYETTTTPTITDHHWPSLTISYQVICCSLVLSGATLGSDFDDPLGNVCSLDSSHITTPPIT